MITVIVCSVNKGLLEKLRSNIAATIGVEYEMLVTDNSIGQRSIAAVYNEAGAKAGFPFLCFVHEDVIIHTKGWGQEIINLLGQKDIGLLGISGAVYKSAYPGSWSTCHPSLYRTNSIQHFAGQPAPVVTDANPEKATAIPVAVIDGVFMATTKTIFDQYRFDEQLLKGFHCYDIDYAMQVGQTHKVMVSYGLLLEHLSEGQLTRDWLKDSMAVHKKWKKQLPLKTVAIDPAIKKESDYRACASVLSIALKSRGNKKLVMHYYRLLLFSFFSFNKLKYTKSVLRYLFMNALKQVHG